MEIRLGHGARVQRRDGMAYVPLCKAKISNTTAVILGSIPQTRMTLAYTIDPFGPSAGHIFIPARVHSHGFASAA